MSKYLILDLEMEQPSDEIIEIGYVVGDKMGRVFENESIYVKIDQPLSSYISELTGISDETLATFGMYKHEVAAKFNSIIERHKVNPKAITWGAGDVRLLLQQYPEILLHNRYLDMKTLFQVEAIANNKTMKKGLFAAATLLNVPLEGRTAHSAKDDAYITYLVFTHYVNKFNNIKQKERK
jgi:DNA polymerase III alpha subunit (gram-positive type)